MLLPAFGGDTSSSEAYGAMLESRHCRGGPISSTTTLEPRETGEEGLAARNMDAKWMEPCAAVQGVTTKGVFEVGED